MFFTFRSLPCPGVSGDFVENVDRQQHEDTKKGSMLQVLSVKLKIWKNWQQTIGDKYGRNTNKLDTTNTEETLTSMTLQIGNNTNRYDTTNMKKNTNKLDTTNTEKH